MTKAIENTGQTDLVERETDLKRLEAALTAGAAGTGKILALVGPAGIGKSSLLAWARGAAQERGVRVLAASATELERSLPFGVCRQLFEPPLSRAGEVERETLMDGAAASGGRLILSPPGLEPGGESDRFGGSGQLPDRPVEPGLQDPGFALLHGLYWLTANLAEREPLLIAVDDAHWADAPSLRLFNYLAHRLDGLPVTLIVAAREDDPSGDQDLMQPLLARPEIEMLRPASLSDRGSAGLIRVALGSAPDLEFSAACRKATRGNPFYLTELLRALRTGGTEPTAKSAGNVYSIGPKAVSREVQARVANLPAGSLELVRALAVLGGRAELREAAALAGLDGAEAARATDALSAAAVLGGDLRLDFSHPILRAAVYEEIPTHERAGAHARAAALLAARGASSPEVAAHLLRTTAAAEAGTREVLREAADRSIAEGDPRAAVAYLRRALAESPPKAERFELILNLGSTLAGEGALEAVDLMCTGLELAPDARARARIAIPLAAALVYAGRAAESIEILDRALTDLAGSRDHRDLTGQLEALMLVMGITDFKARRRLRRRLSTAAGKVRRTPGKIAVAALSPLAIELTFNGGPAEEVVAVARRALGEGELVHDVSATSPLPAVATYALIAAGQPRIAERSLDTAIERATRQGIPDGVSVATAGRCLARLHRGELRGAQTDAETCIQLSDERRPEVFLPTAIAVLALAHLERGDLEAARAALSSPALAALDPDGSLTQPLIECRARVSLAEGDIDAALADLERCRQWSTEWEESSGCWPVQWRATMALAELARGNGPAARELAREDLEVARRFGSPRAIAIALLAGGVCEPGEIGIERLREAVDAVAVCDDRLVHARALVELGSAQRRAGRRTQARKPLAEGMKAARACGATALAERAYEELRATGARPRKILYSGVEALTPSELRVARMARRGMTNREIAQTLFVTPKTVEVHLSHTYQKLDISSRSELPSELGEDPASSD